MFESCYKTKPSDNPGLGNAYEPPEVFPHGEEVLVAELGATSEDGYYVHIHECRLPVRFFTVTAMKASDPDEVFSLGTGTGAEKLVVAIAKALQDGTLGIGKVLV